MIKGNLTYLPEAQPAKDIKATVDQPRRNVLIALSDISLQRDHRRILEDINLTVRQGDFIAITGPNGGGKTTLLRIILRLLKPSTGTVTYHNPQGEMVKTLPIGYLPQKNMIDAHFPIDVEQVIASGLLAQKSLSSQERCQRVREILELVELVSHRRHPIGQLSGGQLQRALLGRALISNPKILVLDEPLSYIDRHFEQHIYKIIADLAPSTTIILVSHEITTIAAMANRHLIVNRTIHECASAHHFARLACDEGYV
ncbi:MAG: metal ABC transporter ATP-binding protein [Bacteroidales bacterium]|nr:metal ABC transporter ATP-binding protein [Bacteroidales bacterium]